MDFNPLTIVGLVFIFFTAFKIDINTDGSTEERRKYGCGELTGFRYQRKFCFRNITQQFRLPFGIELVSE